MNTFNKYKSDRLLKVIDAIAKGDRRGEKLPELPKIIIHNIRHIMNNYTNIPRSLLCELIAASLQTHSPQKALLHLEQFLDAVDESLINTAITTETQLMLSRVFSASSALSRRLFAYPSLVNLLTELETPLIPHLDKEYYVRSIRQYTEKSVIVSEKIKAVHRIQSVQLMRICARNSDPENNIEEINHELTSLAEAVIESCLYIAHNELILQIGIELKPHTLVVLGLGKLGGCELNVSSDIDLIFLCRDDDETWKHYDSIHFRTILAERLIRILSEHTDLGILYRVDTRLRADGASGPLVRSTRDYFRYLEMRGEAWERQMILKARPVAGKLDVGEQFLASIERFIYPKSFSRSPNREIVELKNRIEARLTVEGSKKTHLKLAQGGIRDIEFVVQCLQLLMGGIHPEVRCTGTLAALNKLIDFKAVTAEEYQILSKAYIFYRRIENALQWRELLPAFSLPETLQDMDELASYLHFALKEKNPAALLMEELERNLKAVRSVFNEVFSIESTLSFEEMILQVALNPSGNEKAKRFMESLGFNKPLESARTLSRLVHEKNEGIPDFIVHPSIERFMPKLLKALSKLPDPGGAFERFARITESYQAQYTLFDVLDANSSFFEVLISITHGSIFITDILVREPYLLDWLVEVGKIQNSINTKEIQSELKRMIKEYETDEFFIRECRALKNRETLRIGVRDIIGLTMTNTTFTELTKLAECIVKAFFTREFTGFTADKNIPRDYAFSILAAGRLGAGMMDFGSDLDLIFVYREPSKNKTGFDATSYSIKRSQQILSLIAGGGAQKLYQVDARLRPEGENSVLAVSIDKYKRYLDYRGSEWERLALIRTRLIAGSTSLGSEVSEVLQTFCYQKPFTRTEVKRIIEVRTAMVERSARRYPEQINIKSGIGGLADIDFIAQSFAAHYGADNPSLHHRETHTILKALSAAGIIDRHDVNTLIELHSFLCGVEKAIRIGSGRAVNTVPKSEEELYRISQLQGFKNIKRFKKRIADVTSLTRELYNHWMNELLNQSEDRKNQ